MGTHRISGIDNNAKLKGRNEMMRIKTELLALLVGAFMPLVIGCGSSCKHISDRHPLTISLGREFTHPSAIEVHIFAANAADSPYWEKVSMSKYWGSGGTERKLNENKMFVMHFGPDQAPAQSFSPQTTPDEWKQLWKTWEASKAVNLFVFTTLGSDAAQGAEDKSGTFDPRRLEIPLDRCRWEKAEQPVDVTLNPNRIELATQPLEKSK